ncbi:MAG: CRISPR-associated helicase Cas3' [Anaerolineaceae bacterium]
MDDQIYYAHSHETDKAYWQTVKDHLTNTATIAADLAADAGLSDFAYLAGLLHDIGKYSLAFQRRLEGGPKVDHATAGAQEITRLMIDTPRQKMLGSLLSYCIAGHHGGLPDYGSPVDTNEDGTLRARRKKRLEDYRAYAAEIDVTELIQQQRMPAIRPNPKIPAFSVSFLTRMLYSALVDADFIETETFMNDGKKPRGGCDSISILTERFNHFLDQFANPQKPIHIKRTEILNACRVKSSEKPGLFKLTVPTGGGKTYASMAFALNHAVANGLKRVIYVIPYTSIIEQNAAHFKKALGEDNVLEHHSNFDWDAFKRQVNEETSDENVSLKLMLASETWDIPIVVTTNVQFFESLFSNRSSRCRKLHNLARSVIIFDEAQMLPREYLQPCLYAVDELVRNYGSTAVLCTATQPELERFFPDPKQITELAPDPQGLYEFFKRVQIRDLGKLPDADLLQKINENHQVLCIVNTRRHAKGLFGGIKEGGRFHLSTLMYPAHRRETIATIKERLAQKLPCRVVSTQIMEAGIDVDFPVGFRSISGLDSIIQAAGRVNREGNQASSYLYVFEPDSEFVKKTPVYIRQGAEVARMILRKHSADPTSLEAIAAYYSQLYGLQDPKAFDGKRILSRFDKGMMDGEAVFEFQSAAQDFKLIENDTVAVIIPFKPEAKILLEKVCASEFPLKLARMLQPFTVNIYAQEFEALQAGGAIDLYNDTFDVLNQEDLYDLQTGLTIPDNSGGDAIFFD